MELAKLEVGLMMIEKKPVIRFAGYIEDWNQNKLNSIVERITRKNSNLESTLPLTISAQHGLVDQNTFFNKQVASRDVSNYYLLRNGEFAYNKSYSNGFPLGAIKRLDAYEKGVLSTLYIAFKPTFVDSNFLISYYDTNRWHKEVSMRASEGARNHGLLNISPSDFFDTEVKLPKNTSEQEKIGRFFKLLDETIELHQHELTLLKQRKKAFLQKMFPEIGKSFPEIRFPVSTREWKEMKIKDIGSVSMCKRIYNEQTNEVGGIPFYKIGTFGKLPNSFISRELYKEFKEKFPFPEVGDILISASGTIGKTVIYNGEDAYFQDSNIIWIKRDKELISNIFLKYFYEVVKWSGLEGSTIKRLYNSNILSTAISVPSIEEQEKIGKFFKQLDDSITLQEQKLESLIQLKKAFLQKMFV